MLTIEKVAFLQGVELFADVTPNSLLAAVARIIETVVLPDGETFIREGDIEDCMYIVVDGKVRVHSNQRTIILLGSGKSVGELAVLDPEPRSASVTTIGECRLFRLDRSSFDEVMTDRPGIARGVIRALCDRIRAQGRLMSAGPDGPPSAPPETR